MCKTNKTGYYYDNSKDESFLHEINVAKFFEESVGSNTKLFKTNTDNLFDIYLENLPKEAQQYYTCNACKHFINRFGGLVKIDEYGNKTSVVWDVESTPKFFKKSVEALKNEVEKSKVIGIFIPEEKRLGFDRTGVWTHLHAFVGQGMIHNDRLKTAYQVMAEKLEDFKMLNRALQEFDLDVVNKAVTLLQSETLYRSDRVLGVAQWFKDLQEVLNVVKNSEQKRNLTWLAVATAPNGYTHVRSSMIGTLLEDIASGMSMNFVKSRFDEKMNPSNYQRSQSAPTANQIREAEKLVAELGIENSLQRRYAKLEEIPKFLWKPVTPKKNIVSNGQGVFSHLTPKDKSDNHSDTMSLPSKVMTWEKFARTVLPTADSLEVLVDNPNRFMALVTALDETAPNILQWDNHFSWYYQGGGIDGEIKRRVEREGGRYENNDIRCSLIWENYTDLDLHCVTPTGKHIYYRNKRKDNGWLDVDMNAGGGTTKEPVENIRWAIGDAINGRYKFYVHNFAERVHYEGTPFKVELEIDGQVYTYYGEPIRNNERVTVFEFDYTRGQAPRFITQPHSSSSTWNVSSNNFIKVNGITTSPNLWGENPVLHSGSHVFFLLDGVKDESEGKGKGFLNETLKGDLRAIRKTLELFTDNTPIHGYEEASACGVGYSKDSEWNLTLKVKTGKSTQIIKIDRWD